MTVSRDDWTDCMKYTYRKYCQELSRVSLVMLVLCCNKILHYCLSFYCLIVSKDNTHRNCLVIYPEVREQEKRTWCQSRLVAIKILLNPLAAHGLIELMKSTRRQKGLFLYNHICFGIPLNNPSFFFHRKSELCKHLQLA